MLFLILAIICSGGMAITLRFAEVCKSNLKAVTAANYLFAVVISYLLIEDRSLIPTGAAMNRTLMLGVLNGALFLATLLLYQINIKRNGTPLTVSFARLGVLVPTILSLLVFGEQPENLQWLGVALARTAIIVINYEPRGAQVKNVYKFWLVILFCIAGAADMMSKVFEYTGEHSLGGLFLFYTFLSALLMSSVRLFHGGAVSAKDFAWGLAVGFLNYTSTMFLLQAILRMPAFCAYPIYSVGVILFVNFINFILIREPISKRQYCGMAIIAAALVCLNTV